MKIESEMNSGSKWRRSLMALAVLGAPVVSIAGFSGSASAGEAEASYDVDFDCTAIGDGYLTVTIDPVDINDNFSVHVKPSTVASWPSNNDYRAVNNKEFDNTDFDQIEEYGNGGGTALAVATSYDVKIVADNGNGADTALYEETITILCVAIDFEDIDDFVTIYCSGETPEILVTLPQRDPPSAKGPKYDVYVYENEAKGFDEEVTNLDQGGSAVFATGEGTFEIEIYLAGDEEPVYSNTIEVDCSNARNPGGGYNINLPKTPKLPTTGSNTDTLLILAPMMVLLGGALIAARRRFATV
jgi:LPXTG-motif cell wall-anchored protein